MKSYWYVHRLAPPPALTASKAPVSLTTHWEYYWQRHAKQFLIIYIYTSSAYWVIVATATTQSYFQLMGCLPYGHSITTITIDYELSISHIEMILFTQLLNTIHIVIAPYSEDIIIIYTAHFTHKILSHYWLFRLLNCRGFPAPVCCLVLFQVIDIAHARPYLATILSFILYCIRSPVYFMFVTGKLTHKPPHFISVANKASCLGASLYLYINAYEQYL